MSDAEILYHTIADSLPDAKHGKLFGCPCVKAPNGKAVLFYWPKAESVVFKLTGEAQQEALSLDRAHYFNQMQDRPMNGWVQLSFHYADRWPEFAAQAMEYVRSLR